MGHPARALDESREEALAKKLTRASEAAADLQRTARWNGDVPHLDPRLLLRGLTVSPARYIAIHLGEQRVLVERSRLGRLARIARRLPDLTAFIGDGALSFRWRGGRGGLNFRTTALVARRATAVLIVELHPPVTRRAPRLLGEVLSELIGDLGVIRAAQP